MYMKVTLETKSWGKKNNIIIRSRMKAVVVFFIPAGMCQIS